MTLRDVGGNIFTEAEHMETMLNAMLNALDDMFKYKIGATVATKQHVEMWELDGRGYPHRLQILERRVQQCNGGVQLHYVVRSHNTTGYGAELGAFDPAMHVLAEDELVPYPEIAKKAPWEQGAEVIADLKGMAGNLRDNMNVPDYDSQIGRLETRIQLLRTKRDAAKDAEKK